MFISIYIYICMYSVFFLSPSLWFMYSVFLSSNPQLPTGDCPSHHGRRWAPVQGRLFHVWMAHLWHRTVSYVLRPGQVKKWINIAGRWLWIAPRTVKPWLSDDLGWSALFSGSVHFQINLGWASHANSAEVDCQFEPCFIHRPPRKATLSQGAWIWTAYLVGGLEQFWFWHKNWGQ